MVENGPMTGDEFEAALENALGKGWLERTDDEIAITVARLEAERVAENPRVDDVHTYFDYPGGEPIETAAGMLEDLSAEFVLADMDGAPGTMGYEGSLLSTVPSLDC